MVNCYVYDAGALVAADRNDNFVWYLHKIALKDSTRIVVPAPVLAQAWRKSGQARLAMFLRPAKVWALDAELARSVGELCGAAKSPDIADATVAVLAARLNATVLTSDPHDISRLVEAQDSLRDVEIVKV
jgi:predicted nucleic acid-binding protein